MKIVTVKGVHCDAGWRVNSFLKIMTDDSIVMGARALRRHLRCRRHRDQGH
jgi:hypothetical protein